MQRKRLGNQIITKLSESVDRTFVSLLGCEVATWIGLGWCEIVSGPISGFYSPLETPKNKNTLFASRRLCAGKGAIPVRKGTPASNHPTTSQNNVPRGLWPWIKFYVSQKEEHVKQNFRPVVGLAKVDLCLCTSHWSPRNLTSACVRRLSGTRASSAEPI